MIDSHSALVQNLLARPEIHQQWNRDYRTTDNEDFYEQAFDYLLRALNPSPGATFLDAGCGSCPHSVRLARHGFNVRAVDFSESALPMAQDYVKSKEPSEARSPCAEFDLTSSVKQSVLTRRISDSSRS